MSESIELESRVPSKYTGKRFDQIVALLFPEYSRSRLTTWIKEGAILVDGKVLKPREKLYGGEKILIEAVLENMDVHEAEEMALDIVYEDDAVLVVNKPAGMVVHPGHGNYSGTLINALTFHFENLEKFFQERNVPRKKFHVPRTFSRNFFQFLRHHRHCVIVHLLWTILDVSLRLKIV